MYYIVHKQHRCHCFNQPHLKSIIERGHLINKHTLYIESQYSMCPPPLTTTIRPRDHFCNVALSPVSLKHNQIVTRNSTQQSNPVVVANSCLTVVFFVNGNIFQLVSYSKNRDIELF